MPTINYDAPAALAVTSADTVPVLSTRLTGTISSAANSPNMIGTGTLFLTEIPNAAPFGYLADLTANEIRKIIAVDSNTLLYLDKGFTNAQSSDAVDWCPESGAHRIDFHGDTSGKINNVAIPDGVVVTYEQTGEGTLKPFVCSEVTAYISYQ